MTETTTGVPAHPSSSTANPSGPAGTEAPPAGPVAPAPPDPAATTALATPPPAPAAPAPPDPAATTALATPPPAPASGPAPASQPPDAPDLATTLRMATMRLSRRLRSENVSPCTETQYGVLAMLVHFGPMCPGELAERERVAAPSMTRTVASLEDLGYVARTRHTTDRRQVVVTATDAGREIVEETKRWRNAWLTRNLAGLTIEERETVRRAAEIILRVTEL